MRSCVKNPFGKRNGKLITIGDLTADESGAKCNCVCPDCGGKFVARLGMKRQAHFAHEKDSMCDEEKAFLESVYTFLEESMSREKVFCYPGWYGFYPGFEAYRKASKSDIRSTTNYSNIKPAPEGDYEEIISAKTVAVQRATIERNSKGAPEAMLIYVERKGKEHVLALRIVIPPNICRSYEAKKYKEFGTIAIHVSDELYTIKSDELCREMVFGVDAKEWIFSPLIEKWLDEKVAQQHERYELYERKKTEKHKMEQRMKREMEQQKKQLMQKQAEAKAEAIRLAKEKEIQRQKAWESIKTKVEQNGGVMPDDHHGLTPEENIISKWLSIKHRTPPANKHVRDLNGNRWGLCDECDRWFPDREMPSLGGNGDRMNRGICRWCNKKKCK